MSDATLVEPTVCDPTQLTVNVRVDVPVIAVICVLRGNKLVLSVMYCPT